MRIISKFITAIILVLLSINIAEAKDGTEPIRVLIIDGQNNHNWKVTTPIMVRALKSSDIFDVSVTTSPAKGKDLSDWNPDFSQYDVLVSNYNGDLWPENVRNNFTKFVENGGGLVIVHAANNSFREWDDYNKMIGLGGWGGRTEKDGPYIYFTDCCLVKDTSAGRGGSHGSQHEFQVQIRDAQHPITKGMPLVWLHTKDELYDRLRGPAENMHILATAYSDPSTNGTGRHEPIMMTLNYGKGRIFHTPMGHADYSMKCMGFIATLQRGTEWAATGNVSIPLPDNFPTALKPASID